VFDIHHGYYQYRSIKIGRLGFLARDAPGLYFGIPLTNFLGWLAVSALITLLIGPRGLPAAPLAFVYAATWLLQTIGLGLFWGQPGPALFGFTGMGAAVLLVVLRIRRPGK